MNADRLIQIRTGRPGESLVRVGSGYLLSSGIAVTARHVLLPLDELTDGSLEIEVRTVRGEEWVAAELLWPVQASLDQRPDVAFLRVRGELAGDAVTTTPIGLDPDYSESEKRLLNVYAAGFPHFKQDTADTEQINGTAAPYSGLREGYFELNTTDLNAGVQGARTEAALWKGFSGAPVFAQRRLIGVIASIPAHGRFDFRATRLDRILENPELRQLLPSGLAVAGATAPVERPPVEQLFCLLDRTDQETDFTIAHGRCCVAGSSGASLSSLPLVCILPAVESPHVPYDFVQRLANKVLPELKWPHHAISFEAFPWPKGEDDVTSALDTLRSRLWSKLCGEGAAPSEAAPFAQMLKDPSRTRTFYSEISAKPLRNVDGEILKRWHAFLEDIQLPDPCPPTHLLILSNAGSADARRWLQDAGIESGSRLKLLPELTLCSPLDLGEWLGQRIPHSHRPMIQSIQPDLEREFREDFYARDFRVRVNELINERLHV